MTVSLNELGKEIPGGMILPRYNHSRQKSIPSPVSKNKKCLLIIQYVVPAVSNGVVEIDGILVDGYEVRVAEFQYHVTSGSSGDSRGAGIWFLWNPSLKSAEGQGRLSGTSAGRESAKRGSEKDVSCTVRLSQNKHPHAHTLLIGPRAKLAGGEDWLMITETRLNEEADPLALGGIGEWYGRWNRR